MSAQPTYHYDRKHQMIFVGSRVRVGNSYYTVVARNERFWLSGVTEIPLNTYSAGEMLLVK